MKDIFSTQAGVYSNYRPTFPAQVINEIINLAESQHLAWDCGTGNGQVASLLAPNFNKVIATDISKEQLQYAKRAENIIYKIEPAEKVSIASQSVDLITVAQAVHWFDFEKFYNEVNRVLKEKAVIAILGYNLLKTNSRLDEPIMKFYSEIVGPYWDEERKYIDQAYQTIPFPFSEIILPNYTMNYQWTLQEMIGYFQSWSAVQHYITAKQENPVEWIEEKLRSLWPTDLDKVKIYFEILLRVGRKK